MPPALAQRILDETHAQNRDVYRATLNAVAQIRKVRPVFFERQARAERHKAMAASLARPNMEIAAESLLRGWLLKSQKGLLVDFLTALEIPHQDVVVENLPETVDDAKFKAAIDAVLAKHPREVVAIYLQAFNNMNQTRWAALDTALRSDERLQLA